MPARTRRDVLERDGVCQLQYDCCLGAAAEVDHILGVAELGAGHPYLNDPDNLRGACRPCHARRSEQQKLVGIKASNARRAARRRLPQRPHPGGW
jgi:5-methylcytosine-specific restriction endonuclease McrA